MLAQPLDEHKEGILHADHDFPLIAGTQSAADPVEHCWRPDELRAPGRGVQR